MRREGRVEKNNGLLREFLIFTDEVNDHFLSSLAFRKVINVIL
jgi:hypothetical protein